MISSSLLNKSSVTFREPTKPTQTQIIDAINKASLPADFFYFIKLACTNNCIEVFSLAVSNQSLNSDIPNTSCTNTAIAVMGLFTGKEEGKKNSQNIFLKTFPRTFTFNSDFVFNVHTLFDGVILAQINRDRIIRNVDFDALTNEKKEEKVQEFITPFIKSFISYVQNNFIDKDLSCEMLFNNINFDFNEHVFSFLSGDLDRYSQQINLDVSFVYLMGITNPQSKYSFSWIHMWVIEQFYSRNDKEIRYRLYHSSIDQVTLLTDLNKRGYGLNGEGAWTRNTLNWFLFTVKKLCSDSSQNLELWKSCFGYDLASFPLLTVIKENDQKILSGNAFKYWAVKTRPSQAQTNFINLLATISFNRYDSSIK